MVSPDPAEIRKLLARLQSDKSLGRVHRLRVMEIQQYIDYLENALVDLHQGMKELEEKHGSPLSRDSSEPAEDETERPSVGDSSASVLGGSLEGGAEGVRADSDQGGGRDDSSS